MSLTSLLLAGLLGATAAGCAGTSDAGADKAAAAPFDPKAALASSTSGLKAGNYAFTTTTPDSTNTGIRHFASNSASVKGTSPDLEGSMELRYVDPNQYVRMTLSAKEAEEMTAGLDDIDTSSDPQMAKLADSLREMADMFSGKFWMHMDREKVKGRDYNLDMSDGDITGLTELLSKATVTKGDATTITGTLDATGVDENDGMVDTDAIKAMGAAAKKLPYIATLDDKGRISKVEITAPKGGDVPAGKWTFAVTGYGAQQPQLKPTGTIKETPDSAYKMLNA